jgi:hypothetical protein
MVALDKIDYLVSLLNECMAVVKAHGESKEAGKVENPSCGENPEMVVATLQADKRFILDARKRNDQLASASRDLSGVRSAAIRKEDLPPREICSSCDALWKDLGEAAELHGNPIPFLRGSNRQEVEQEEKRTAEAVHKLCHVRDEMESYGAQVDAEHIESKLAFYTWTASWDTYRHVRDTLKSLPREACQQ